MNPPEQQNSRASQFRRAAVKGGRQMQMMLPVLVGVILLVGLFKTFVSDALISSVFTGDPLSDSFFGAALGSVLAGNPVNSYVVGKGLLDMHVGMVGVTAFILTWVTVGLVQLPAEVASLGVRFGVTRAIAAFGLALPLAYLTSWLVNTAL